MADPKGFLKYTRVAAPDLAADGRVQNFNEFHLRLPESEFLHQAARCMDCGIPFCHNGCPLGNLIPEWNDLAYRERWEDAIKRLHATNSFPEFTGKLCPAPCEEACVLGINQPPVNIKMIEETIIHTAFEEGWVKAEPPLKRTGKKVAVVGSGPSGLAAAAQLNRAGHSVVVFERSSRIGGLLRYGIPDFKIEKWIIDRRLAILEEEGIEFRTGVNVGFDIDSQKLLSEFDAVVLCGGSTIPRDLPVPGRELKGVHYAMEFLTQQNYLNAGDDLTVDPISATGKHVVVIGGGDTGSDCVGTSIRQGAASVTQVEIMPKPPTERAPSTPWPLWSYKMRTSSSHEEGCARDWDVLTKSFTGKSGVVKNLNAVRVKWEGRNMSEVAGSEFTLKCDLALLAMGFVHPQHDGPIGQLGVELNERGNVQVNSRFQTSVPKVFSAGDMRRGQSLIVWAISEGRECARGVDEYLMGRTDLTLNGAKRW